MKGYFKSQLYQCDMNSSYTGTTYKELMEMNKCTSLFLSYNYGW